MSNKRYLEEFKIEAVREYAFAHEFQKSLEPEPRYERRHRP